MGSITHNAQSPRGGPSRNISPHPPSSSSKRYLALKMAPQSGHASSPNTPSSPSLRYAHPTNSSRSSTRKVSVGSIGGDSPPTPVSKASAKDSQHSSQQSPQSSLLQEKLQRERMSEIHRNLDRLAGDMGAGAESRAAILTVARCGTADGRRQETPHEFCDSRNKGLALKETEQVLVNPV